DPYQRPRWFGMRVASATATAIAAASATHAQALAVAGSSEVEVATVTTVIATIAPAWRNGTRRPQPAPPWSGTTGHPALAEDGQDRPIPTPITAAPKDRHSSGVVRAGGTAMSTRAAMIAAMPASRSGRYPSRRSRPTATAETTIISTARTVSSPPAAIGAMS